MRNLSYENKFCMQFHFDANQSHFNKNGFALKLALEKRHKGTRKWQQTYVVIGNKSRCVNETLERDSNPFGSTLDDHDE